MSANNREIMLETIPPISKALENVCTNAIFNLKRKYKKRYVTKIMYTGAGALN